MQEGDRAPFIELMTMLTETYGRKPLTEAALAAYWMALSDISIETIRQRATSHLKTSEFFPKPSDLRNQTDISDIAVMAWDTTYKAIKKYGGYQSVRFSDPVIHSVIHVMGGWEEVCWSDEDYKWVEKRFLDLYRAMARKPAHEHPQLLVGRLERENHSNGFASGEFIGLFIPVCYHAPCDLLETIAPQKRLSEEGPTP